MRKTIKEWLQELPPGYRQLALKNMEEERQEHQADSMHDAINSAFTWVKTKQGLKFWDKVHRHYVYKGHLNQDNYPLPVLPPGLLREPEAFRAKISLIAGAGGHRA